MKMHKILQVKTHHDAEALMQWSSGLIIHFGQRYINSIPSLGNTGIAFGITICVYNRGINNSKSLKFVQFFNVSLPGVVSS